MPTKPMIKDQEQTLPDITDPRPPEIITRTSLEFDQVMTQIKSVNARVLSLERLPHCNAGWRLRIRWPENLQVLTQVSHAGDQSVDNPAAIDFKTYAQHTDQNDAS